MYLEQPGTKGTCTLPSKRTTIRARPQHHGALMLCCTHAAHSSWLAAYVFQCTPFSASVCHICAASNLTLAAITCYILLQPQKMQTVKAMDGCKGSAYPCKLCRLACVLHTASGQPVSLLLLLLPLVCHHTGRCRGQLIHHLGHSTAVLDWHAWRSVWEMLFLPLTY